MKLYLAQHGNALTKDINPDRPLSEVGQLAVEQLARSLAECIEVSRVIHSGKTRSRQTAEILARYVCSEPSIEEFNGINPNDPVEAFAQLIDDWNDDLLVVGHLPFMSKLVSLLLTGSIEETIVAYTPGSIVSLELVEEEGWQLLWMVSPELFSH